MKRLWIAVSLGLAGLPSLAVAQDSHLLVISGLGGDEAHAEQFHDWATQLVDIATHRYDVPDAHITYLGDAPDRDPERIDGRSTRENVTAAFARIADAAGPGDRVFIVLIGHGSARGNESRFNLPGPDLSAADFAPLLDRLAGQAVVLVNTASASGGFIPALSAPGRTLVTATKTPGEQNETRFAEFFVQAFDAPEADADKNEQISVLEAFRYARRRVVTHYEEEGLLLTEHALLDDDGDGAGSSDLEQQDADGALARTLFLTGGHASTLTDAAAADPAARRLSEEAQAIEDRLAELRASKDQMDPDAYAADLERLLTELAIKSRALRELQGKTP